MIQASSSQSEIAQFDFAISINQNIVGFKISMDNSCRVHVFEDTTDLINEVLNVVLSQRLIAMNYLL